MAKEHPSPTSAQPAKLPRLPSGHKIQKRPLLHPPIASSRISSSTPKIIYVSSSTPFISTVKRVRAYLAEIEKRAAGTLKLSGGEKKLLRSIEGGVNSGKGKEGERGAGKRGEEVLIKGTGKAIEKVVRMAAWWREQSDVVVVVRTGSVGAVDDVLDPGGEGEGGEGESRVRRVSCLEVGVRLR